MLKQENIKNCLALERTDMAIDRTLLAYIRTSLTIIVVGASSIKFFDSAVTIVFGWLMISAALILFIFGIRRCLGLRKKNNGKTFPNWQPLNPKHS